MPSSKPRNCGLATAISLLFIEWASLSLPANAAPIEWIHFDGGSFDMGSAYDGIHKVNVPPFFMAKTDVTVAQYAKCVNAGRCTQPGKDGSCNWDKPYRGSHPINCVTWYQAVAYAKFVGARLPSEAEWEYAARSGGLEQRYPWGGSAPDCERAVMFYTRDIRCDDRTTRPVCSRPLGNTRQGLCDMVGNVLQWVEDTSYDNYVGAPTDGSAREESRPYRVIRGGAFLIAGVWFLQSTSRTRGAPEAGGPYLGFRIAKDSR